MQTSAVYGMPKVAFELGGVDVSLPLDEIYKYIIAWAKNIES
jgi:chemotaxis response regulator CheB